MPLQLKALWRSYLALHWGASAFNASLDEAWGALPPLDVAVNKLRDWGIWDDSLGTNEIFERYVRFDGVTFGIAPEPEWAKLR